MKKRTPAVAYEEVSAWSLRVSCRIPVTPAVVSVPKSREPKWYVVTAWATSAIGFPAIPTRNSWPTRWASVIREKIRLGQEGAAAEGAAAEGAGGEDVTDAPTPPPHAEQA